MCYILSDQQLCETFDQLDINQDGRLSRNEIAVLWKIINVEPTRVELDFIFQEMDPNKTGSISKEDFIRYMSTPPAHHTTLTELERYFRLYDNDGDGAITIDQVLKILEETIKVTNRELIEEKFQLIDTNHDGRISFDEFMSMIKES
uniref:EF-hand domain-containing protein n=1 Tax=Wuchereria bancrofti TaxID=6293 RepID=A0AAF5RUV2_WUCBA